MLWTSKTSGSPENSIPASFRIGKGERQQREA